jgi:Sec-independent protein translocase protein TatA
MNRNGKIALGCGGAGCLGVILLIIVFVVLIVTGTIKAPGLYDANRNSNSNFNFNSRNTNSNSNSNANTDNSNSDSSTSDSSSMTDDDKHKLFYAASVVQDGELNGRVWTKLGLMRNHTPTDAYQPFVKEHIRWLFSNTDFLQTINTAEKGRAYVDEHIND